MCTILCVLMLFVPFTFFYASAAELGDVNHDGKITATDARLVLRYSAQLTVDENFDPSLADTNGNGKIDATDARNILRYAAKLNIDVKGTPAPTTAAPTTTKRDPSSYKIAVLGDSLVATIGLYDYKGVNNIDFYGKVNLGVSTIFSQKVQGSSRYVIDEVNGRNYDKVVLFIGINEVGNNTSAWGSQYRKVIQGLKQRAPGAEIYAHAIMPISAAASAKNNWGCNNNAINEKNEVVKRIASEEGVHFIDAGEILRNSQGVLPADAASDGIHLNYTYSEKWVRWLLGKIC